MIMWDSAIDVIRYSYYCVQINYNHWTPNNFQQSCIVLYPLNVALQ